MVPRRGTTMTCLSTFLLTNIGMACVALGVWLDSPFTFREAWLYTTLSLKCGEEVLKMRAQAFVKQQKGG